MKTTASAITIESPGEMIRAAEMILKNAGDARVFALYGEMGAGKTVLVKALCRLLDVTDTVSSPTFSIINEYQSASGLIIYHFDFYRIKAISEAFDLGYENYFFSGNYCFIEWPEKIASLMDFPHLKIHIAVSGKKRIVTLPA